MRRCARGARRRELAALLRLGVPLAGANLAELGMVVTDMAIVGRLGPVELAAVGLGGGILVDVTGVLMGVVTVVGVLVAEAHGAGDRARVAAVTWQSVAIAVVLSAAPTLLGLHLARLLAHAGQSPEVLVAAEAYLRGLVWFVVPAMVYTVLFDVLLALGRTRVVFLVSLGAVLLNAVTSWALVFGIGGVGGIGVAGAGYATSLVNVAMCAVALGYCLVAPDLACLLRPVDLRPQRRIWKDVFRVGTPVGGITLAENGMFSVFAIAMGTFGSVALAASRIVFGYVKVTGALAFALGDAAAIRVAHAVGAGEPARAHRAGFLALAATAACLAPLAVVAVLQPDAIIAVFLGTLDEADRAVVPLASALLTLGAIYLVVSGLQTVGEHALRGLQDTLAPMWISAFGLWGVGLLGGLALAFPLGHGPQGLWWGLCAGSTLTAALFARRFTHRLRR
ncbi:MAG: MATE family efflux transporter [Ectothiorhodospiraceae bacterium]|nr:MATE family efflux transporter [Ectothiorhodospiraceae bacterium]